MTVLQPLQVIYFILEEFQSFGALFESLVAFKTLSHIYLARKLTPYAIDSPGSAITKLIEGL
jgi:hypothetical protein